MGCDSPLIWVFLKVLLELLISKDKPRGSNPAGTHLGVLTVLLDLIIEHKPDSPLTCVFLPFSKPMIPKIRPTNSKPIFMDLLISEDNPREQAAPGALSPKSRGLLPVGPQAAPGGPEHRPGRGRRVPRGRGRGASAGCLEGAGGAAGPLGGGGSWDRATGSLS